MKKPLFLFLLSAIFCCVSSYAQPQVILEKQVERFRDINVSDDLVVELVHSTAYGVSATVDELVAAYVKVYVESGTLYVQLNEKGFSTDLKKQIRNKERPEPALKVKIHMPYFKGLTISGNASIVHCDKFYTDSLTVTMSEKSSILGFEVECSVAELSISDNARLSSGISASQKIEMYTSNSAEVDMTLSSDSAYVKTSGNSQVRLNNAELGRFEQVSSSSSRCVVQGNASCVKVVAANISRSDLKGLNTSQAEIFMTGSARCHINATDLIKVSLTGASMIVYENDPSFEIQKIVGSTILKSSDYQKNI